MEFLRGKCLNLSKVNIISESERKRGFPGGSDGNSTACNAKDPGSIPGSGRFPGEGRGNSL